MRNISTSPIFPNAQLSSVDQSFGLHSLVTAAFITPPHHVATFIKAIVTAVVASTLAIAYSEILFSGTRALYMRGKLLRYYPLPAAREIVTAWNNTLSFTVPTSLYVFFFQASKSRSLSFNPIALFLWTLGYMLMHDVYFYTIHRVFHSNRGLYKFFHAMHHEYSYAMHAFHVGYAEIVENFVQVGVPWVVWTAIAGGNWWYWISPLSLVVFTTLVGHSGYRMSPLIMMFHPLIIPVVLLSGKHMLTPGDHQVHHSHRRYNFGLFWRTMDRWGGTYKKCDVRAQNVAFWTKWVANKDDNSEQAKKWMGRNQVAFHEIEWGF